MFASSTLVPGRATCRGSILMFCAQFFAISLGVLSSDIEISSPLERKTLGSSEFIT
jgi:hypothetical protein